MVKKEKDITIKFIENRSVNMDSLVMFFINKYNSKLKLNQKS